MGGDGGRDVTGVGQSGIRSHSQDLFAFHLIILSCLRKVIVGNCEQGYEGKLIQRSQIEVVKGVLLTIIL